MRGLRATIRTSLAATALCVGSLGGGPAASANTISSVTHKGFEDSRTIALYGTRSGILVTLDDAIDLGRCAGMGVPVRRVTVTRTGAGLPRTETFDFESGLRASADCTTLRMPMRLKPEGRFSLRVELADGTVLAKDDVQLEALQSALGSSPDSLVALDADVLYADKEGKLGLSVDTNVDLRLAPIPLFSSADSANLTFHGETVISGDSSAFKEALKLESAFSWLFGPVGSYYEVIAKPLALEADDDLRNINYKGSLGIAARVPGTVALGLALQPLFGGCDQLVHNCTSNGLIVGASYEANAKLKRQNGRIDRSDDAVATLEALWRIPLNRQLTLSASYKWQSDSPDGSTSEASEVAVTYSPGCSGVGMKLSFIDGEFLPGQQRRDAVRFGLTRLLGAATGKGGC